MKKKQISKLFKSAHRKIKHYFQIVQMKKLSEGKKNEICKIYLQIGKLYCEPDNLFNQKDKFTELVNQVEMLRQNIEVIDNQIKGIRGKDEEDRFIESLF